MGYRKLPEVRYNAYSRRINVVDVVTDQSRAYVV
jgi:hypothetical protein